MTRRTTLTWKTTPYGELEAREQPFVIRRAIQKDGTGERFIVYHVGCIVGTKRTLLGAKRVAANIAKEPGA